MTDSGDGIEFDYGALGREWWLEAAKSVGATEKHARFAAAKVRGCSNTQAAREAGYTGTADQLKTAAYKAYRTTAVQSLLALAAAESQGENVGHVDDAEVRRVLDKLIRGSDPAIRIRAIEAMDKRNANATAAGKAPDDDGFRDWRDTRDFLQMRNGATAWVSLFAGQGEWIGNLKMFRDVYERLMQEDLGPDLWRLLRNKPTVSKDSQIWLDKQIADPTYQFAARQKIWREIGIEIDAPPGAKVEPVDTPTPTGDSSNETEH